MRSTLFLSLVLSTLAAGPAARAASAKLDLDSGRPMVDLRVNGRGPYRFVFDTGSPQLLVTPALVEALGLEETGRTDLVSPVGGTPLDLPVVRVDSIDLGGATVEGLEAAVLDMGVPELGMGVVGPVLFRAHGGATLDFRNDTVTLGDPVSTGKETWMAFGESAPLLDAPVRIGELEVLAHIDTGSPGVLSLPNALEERLPLAGPVRTIGHARTVDAEFELRGAPLRETVRVGDATIPVDQVVLSDAPVANLGTAALRGLVLRIDWEGRRFALSGAAAPAAAGPRRVVRQAPAGDGPRFGMRAVPQPDGTILISGTDPGSPAEAIGLQPGDHLLAINGRSMSELEFAQVRAELGRPDLKLTVERDGRTLQLEADGSR